MKHEEYIPVSNICMTYRIEHSFIDVLDEHGLIEIIEVEHSPCIHIDLIPRLEKMIRLNDHLKINPEGIDAILFLLDRIKAMEEEMWNLKNRLRIYE